MLCKYYRKFENTELNADLIKIKVGEIKCRKSEICVEKAYLIKIESNSFSLFLPLSLSLAAHFEDCHELIIATAFVIPACIFAGFFNCTLGEIYRVLKASVKV